MIRKWWAKFRRWLGIPLVDLELQVQAPFVVEYDFLTLSVIIRRDIQYWLDRVIGENNWSHNIAHVTDLNQSFIDLDHPALVMLKFRHQRDLDLFKTNWFYND